MQEILFSAKRIDNGYTVYGYHIKDGVTGKHFIVAEGSMLHESDKVGEEGLLNFVAFEVDEDTISVTDDGWIPAEERMPEKDGFVHCNDCPLVVDRKYHMCRANSHYDRRLKEWVPDEVRDK